MSLDEVIRHDHNKSYDAFKVVLKDLPVSIFMNRYGLSRDITAQYIRFYRKELNKYNHLTRCFK
jgi:hypothetical protein